MANGGAGLTAKGNLCHAKLSDVCNWVKRSWEGISPETIIQSFKTCGISNPLIEDINKKNEEFEIIGIGDNIGDFDKFCNKSIDMIMPQARYVQIKIHFLIYSYWLQF